MVFLIFKGKYSLISNAHNTNEAKCVDIMTLDKAEEN